MASPWISAGAPACSRAIAQTAASQQRSADGCAALATCNERLDFLPAPVQPVRSAGHGLTGAGQMGIQQAFNKGPGPASGVITHKAPVAPGNLSYSSFPMASRLAGLATGRRPLAGDEAALDPLGPAAYREAVVIADSSARRGISLISVQSAYAQRFNKIQLATGSQRRDQVPSGSGDPT